MFRAKIDHIIHRPRLGGKKAPVEVPGVVTVFNYHAALKGEQVARDRSIIQYVGTSDHLDEEPFRITTDQEGALAHLSVHFPLKELTIKVPYSALLLLDEAVNTLEDFYNRSVDLTSSGQAQISHFYRRFRKIEDLPQRVLKPGWD